MQLLYTEADLHRGDYRGEEDGGGSHSGDIIAEQAPIVTTSAEEGSIG